MRIVVIALLVSLVSIEITSQERQDDPWAPLRVLEGHWEAAIDGKLGTGTGVREYEFILNGLYLLSRHASVRQPQEKSPEGDHHRELSVFSYDTERDTLVLRQFVIEGFVNRYVCDTAGSTLVCTSEYTESGPAWTARLTLDIKNAYRFEEVFELGPPGEELEVYFTNVWTRAPSMP